MEHLPDDALLAVMQYLDVPDLLACRLVCKRIGGLALHPHLWRRRRVRVSHTNRCCLPVLRLAPCLASLDVKLPAEDRLLYSTTKCAVSTLTMMVYGGSAMYAALVIRNQEMLGRLRHVSVRYRADETGADAPALLWPLALTSGLEGLAVHVTSGRHDYVISTTSLPTTPTTRPRSSLIFFRCNLRPELGPFCDFVLASHTDTMEVVDLGCFHLSTTALTSTASLLAGMPNLRKLYNCPLLPGLDAVAACESLERVSLSVGRTVRHAVPQAKEFLRRAKQLRNVTIQYTQYRYKTSETGVGEDLVLGLVSSGPSLVQSLTIFMNGNHLLCTHPQLRWVVRAMPSMPALQKVQLQGGVSEELLLAITPATNPALRTLKLGPPGQTGPGIPRCAHGYLHWDVAATLLSRNPSLELVVYASYYCSRKVGCEPCELGCHKEVWKSKCTKWHGVFTEDNPYTGWIHIPRLNLTTVPTDPIA